MGRTISSGTIRAGVRNTTCCRSHDPEFNQLSTVYLHACEMTADIRRIVEVPFTMTEEPSRSRDRYAAWADCAFWSIQTLARQMREQSAKPSEIIEQIIFTARALRTYSDQINCRIPDEFTNLALQMTDAPLPVNASCDELLFTATVVAMNAEPGESTCASIVENSMRRWLVNAISAREHGGSLLAGR